ncbi:MAG: hypothetical protein HRT45_15505, partial [Bdellovibrionales bacterium]|nr:hypothetical protein [Bdellovibrionales bacterium]
MGHQLLLDDEGSNLLTIGVNYSEITLTDKTLFGPDGQRVLRTLIPDAKLMKILSDEYSLVVNLRPGFYGDLKGDLGNDFRLEGGVVVTRLMTDSLTLGLGVGRGSNLGRDVVVPLLQFLYFASDRVVMRGLLPVQASVWYIPDQKWEFGGLFRLNGSLYKIENTELPEVDKLGFGSAYLGLSARRKVTDKSFAVIEGGMSFLRRYEWTDRVGTSLDTSQEPPVDRELGEVPYIRVGW